MSEHSVGIRIHPQAEFITIRHLDREEPISKGGIHLVNHESIWVMAEVQEVGPGVDLAKIQVKTGDIILVNSDDGIEAWGVRIIRAHMVYAVLEGVNIKPAATMKEQS